MFERASKSARNLFPPRIPEFFAGRHVLVTGGTGFMGKVLLEKLMRSCPDIASIYILLRPKRGKTTQDRLAEMLTSPLFSVLKEQRPGLAERVLVALEGDVSLIGLGLSDKDRALLQDNVSVVFHGAATVLFNEPLKKAIIINVRGTREVVTLAQGMPQLTVFAHISTTYCNTDRPVIDELVYSPHADWKQMIRAAETISDRELDILTPKLLQGLPNTYTFTKSLGEHCAYDHADRLPLVIFRPSIVISSMSEPLVGWIDNFHGPVGLMVAAGKGVVHIALADQNVIADYMPVDIAIKALIVSAWERATAIVPRRGPDVYNCSSAAVKPVTMRQMITMAKPLSKEIPFDNILWPTAALTTNSSILLLLGTLVLHMLPALVIDTVLLAQGKKARLWRLQRRIYAAQVALAPFLLNSWTFRNSRSLELIKAIREEDKKDFDFDVRDADELEYLRGVTMGGRRYLLKERDEDLPKAQLHYHRMLVLDRVVKTLLFAVFLYLVVIYEIHLIPFRLVYFLLTL